MVKDYTNSIIYKLCCKDTNIKEIYIGSTTDFIKRRSIHKSDCNNLANYTKVYEFIRANGDWKNWEMVIIEYYNANDFRDLTRKEREWYDRLKPSLNSYRPNITYEERKEQERIKIKKYYREHKEKIKKDNKIYREKNKIKIKEDSKKYREKNEIKIKEDKKKYYHDNAEKIKEKYKKYYEINKIRINEKRKIKVKCICGKEVTKYKLKQHEKSKYHIRFINQNNK